MSKYTDLITSQHADKPKYIASIEATTNPLVDLIATLQSIPAAFDLDDADGAQLDVVGQWVGAKRQVETLLTGVYFAFDTPGLGFDQGVWRGPFDSTQGLTTLADDPYRLLIRATIALNNWDGTTPSAAAALAPLFPNNAVYLQDNQDMTMSVAVSGPPADPVAAALLTGGYLALRATTVRFSYFFASTADSPVFGFDADNDYIGGFDHGSWGISAPFAA